jgi:hypothetical protein
VKTAVLLKGHRRGCDKNQKYSELGQWRDCNQLLLHPTCVIFLERCLYRYKQVQNLEKGGEQR